MQMEKRPVALEISGGKRDLRIDPPILNAAGILGYGEESRRLPNLGSLGAFVTNPISLSSRSPARGTRFVSFKGGFLLHTGHPNPGCLQLIQSQGNRWKKFSIPIIAHLLATSAEDLFRMLELLEPADNVQAVELGLQGSTRDLAFNLVSAAVSGELPIIACLPQDSELGFLQLVEEAGAHAVSMGPPRGTCISPAGELVSGRLYGPHLLPRSLFALQAWKDATTLPIIAGGGVYHPEKVRAIFELGARAVQLDTILWTEPETLLSIGAQ